MGFLARIFGPRVLLGLLLASGVGLGWLWWQHSGDASAVASAQAALKSAQADIQTANASAKAWKEEAHKQREKAREAFAKLAQRQQRLAAMSARLEAQRRAYEKEKQHDAQLKQWGDTRLPDYIIGRLCQFAAADAAPGASVLPECPGPGHGADAGTAAPGSQRRSSVGLHQGTS